MSRTALAPLMLALVSLACSSSESGSPTNTDTGTASTDSGASTDTGTTTTDAGTCAGLSGTYDSTRKRSTTSPGSCSPTTTFAPAMPVRISADAGSPSGYKVEVGYTNTSGEVIFSECVNNVSGCKVFATCSLETATDQLTFTITDNKLSGTIARTYKDPVCTLNFDVSGTRK